MRHLRATVLAALTLLVSGLAVAQGTSGLVERVIDGDTIVVQGIGTVRLIGVDTPETVDPRKAVQYFGAEASAFTRQLADRQIVRLEFEGSRTDRYNRTLAYVYLPDGTLLNGEIIRQGYGHAYVQVPFSKMQEFRAFEREARTLNRGLWAPDAAQATQTGSPAANAPTKAVAKPTAGPTETVYATRTGTKYHRAGCRHLARSQIPMPLKEAAARYGPCSVCAPPVLARNE